MEDIIWLGSLFAMAVFGYYVMYRLGIFLEKTENQTQEKPQRLHIAASAPEDIPLLLNVAEKYPDMEYVLSVGQEEQIVNCLKAGNVDAAIVSAQAKSDSNMQCELLDLDPVPFTVCDSQREIFPVETCVQHRKIVWNTGVSLPFIKDICKYKF